MLDQRSISAVSADSFSLSIPLTEIKFLDGEIYSRYQFNRDSFEAVIGDMEDTSLVILEENPRVNSWVKRPIALYRGESIGDVSFSIQKVRSRGLEPCLIFSVNSKMLLEDYLKGVTLDTHSKVYHFLQSLELFEFSYDSFLNAHVSDLDLKMDFYREVPFRALTFEFKKCVKESYSSTFKSFGRGENCTGFVAGVRSPVGANLRMLGEIKLYDKRADMFPVITSKTRVRDREILTRKSLFTSYIGLSKDDCPYARFECTYRVKAEFYKSGLLDSSVEPTLLHILKALASGRGEVALSSRCRDGFYEPVSDFVPPVDDIGSHVPESVKKKVYNLCTVTALKHDLSIEDCIAVMRDFCRKNDHKWLRGYIQRIH
ncbi:hypothetical protein, partial [Vibrio breoganii]|uniref:hypothetical protein n=1 Tax=Vibrio breoganii TaxID=553239 RepID=UPI001055586D